MSSSAKAMLLAAIIGSCAYLSLAAEKAAWNSPSGQDFATVGGNFRINDTRRSRRSLPQTFRAWAARGWCIPPANREAGAWRPRRSS